MALRLVDRILNVLPTRHLRWCGCMACLMALVACSSSGSGLANVRRLNIALSVELSSLDPQTTISVDAIKVQSALFETLVRVNAQTGAIEAGGATAWEIGEHGRIYRFELDPDLCWSDGSPLQASDYVFALRRLMDPRLAAPFADLYFGIVGARDLHLGKQVDASEFGVRALDPSTLEIELERATPYFLSLLARPCAAALPEAFLRDRGAVDSRTRGWTLEPGFPVSGPYQLERWTVNEQIELRKNERHPFADRLSYDVLHFYPIESAYAQEHGFQTGALDVISKLASERIAAYRGKPELVSEVEMGTFYVITQTRSPALQEISLRQLLSASVDREAIVKQLRQREEQPAIGFVPPIWEAYHPKLGQAKRVFSLPEQAPQIERTKLRLLISSSEGNLLIAEALQSMWMEELPVEVEIVRQEWKSYLDSRSRGEFDLCLATWIGDYYDPLTFLELWHSEASNNFCQWQHEEYDALLAAAAKETHEVERLQLLARAEELLMEHAPILPLFYLSRVYLKAERVESWPQTLLNTVNYLELR